jgi:hypothetical protein
LSEFKKGRTDTLKDLKDDSDSKADEKEKP